MTGLLKPLLSNSHEKKKVIVAIDAIVPHEAIVLPVMVHVMVHVLALAQIADRAAMVRQQQRPIRHELHAAHILKRHLNYLSVPALSGSSRSMSIVKPS